MFLQCLPAEVKEETNEKFCKVDEKVGKVDEKVGRVDEKVGKVDEKVEKMQIDVEALKGLHPQPSKYKVFLTL